MSEIEAPRKVIVAVHGVGNQTRYATVQQVVAQFARYHGEAAAVPLGRFHGDGSLVLTPDESPQLSKLAFAEVYWADIPRKVVDEKYVLEDVQAWVRTIVGRIKRRESTTKPLTDADARMVEQVLGEMLQTISVLERLCFLAEKMGVFSFDLKKVLVDFVDDVQIVAEFKQHGGEIGKVFSDQMQALDDQFKSAEEIYVVAHSEGTVVALLGLLTALCSPANPWISKVRGFMTFGSPIDKHLIFWPELFAKLQELPNIPDQPIEWHNYYDYGDPIGFELDTARLKLSQGGWQDAFNFPNAEDGKQSNDHGFARYPFPGKAHNDYWRDVDVFGHFIRNVVYSGQVKPKPKPDKFVKPPGNKQLFRAISWGAPYLGAAALMFLAVLVLYKAVHGYLDPKAARQDLLAVFGTVGSLSCLLAGVTVLARIPRLTRVWTWRLFGLGFFLLSAVGYQIFPCVDPTVRNAAGGLQRCFETRLAIHSENLSLILAAIALLAGIYLVSKLKPTWGMRTLLVPGAIAVVIYLYLFIHQPDAPAHQGDLWPVFLAGAAFLYLWWLVALLFDLTFVWHRYIRLSVAVFRVQEQARGLTLAKPAVLPR